MRPRKTTVEYFPHMTTSGKTIFILESLYGNDGYAAWFKILEILGSTDGHSYNFSIPANMQYLSAKLRVSGEKTTEILKTLAELGAIDSELHASGIIWSDNFVKNVECVYSKRSTLTPQKPSILRENKDDKGVSGEKTPQSIVEESREEKALSASPAPEGSKRNGIPYKEIIDKLNEVCGTSYQHSTKATQQLIKARFNEGRTVEDFYSVIDSRAALWLADEKMLQYLRPSTLFGNKFEGYLVAARVGIKPKQKGRGPCTQCSNNYLPRCKEKSDEERARCNHFAEVEA